MYEDLIQFLLGRKEELSEDDIREFMDLLNHALDIHDDTQDLEKQTVIDSMVETVNVRDEHERNAISTAIGSILHFEGDSEEEDEKIMEEKEVPLRARKVRRGSFGRDRREDMAVGRASAQRDDTRDSQSVCRPSQIFSLGGIAARRPGLAENEAPKKASKQAGDAQRTEEHESTFRFEIGELEENHNEGPEFSFCVEE